MRWTTQAAACLVAVALAACGPRDRAHGPGAETGSMGDTAGTAAQPDMTRDTTGMGGMPADTVNQSQPVKSKGDTIDRGADSAR